MRIAVPDLISNSYFPAIAAVELGLMREEGLDVELDLLFPVTDAARALRDGSIDLLAGAAHAPLYAADTWGGIKLVAALSHNTYWHLVVRADSDVVDLAGLRDLRIGAAPGVDVGLEQLLIASGVDVDAAGITIAPVPGADADSVSFGVTSARALADGRIDAFWANGMGSEVAVREGAGRVVYDARRAGGPATHFTFPALMTTSRTVEEQPDVVAAAVRAVVRAQQVLREDPERARAVGESLFPPMEAGLIADLVRRDLPFYDATITEQDVAGMNDFATSAGLLAADAAYTDVVATRFAPLWTSGALATTDGRSA
ncbi:ABC transporter substrate-binding protein [Georgenia subflava]|uniref:ABC transporter substrate-binding protein n=2 Tax=Georgenia subflava TaxID=1622177 RepID=A0A6N7EF10_9MICO|nr:ABC transporter substrate-binding protein [Georgenia subflava]